MKPPRINMILIIAAAIAINLYIHRKEMVNPYVVEPDVTSNYIMYFQDQSLFTRDLLCRQVRNTFPFAPLSGETIKSLLLSISLVYYFLGAWLFAFLSRLLSLPQFITFLSVSYSVIAAVFLFRIGGLFCKKPIERFYLVFFFIIYSATMDAFFGGLPRGIGFILICALYYYLCLKEPGKLIPVIILTGLFDLHVLPIAVLSLVLLSVKRYMKREYRPGDIVVYGVVFAVISIIISLSGVASWEFFSGHVGNHMEWKWMLKNPSGEVSFGYLASNFVLNLEEHSVMYAYLTLFLIAANFLFSFAKPRHKLLSEGEIIFVISGAGAFLFTAPFNLGIASRQLIFSLPLLLVVLFWKQLIYRSQERPKAIALLVAILAFIFIAFNRHSNELADMSRKRQYFNGISSLPKDALIAGHPDDIVYVPFFCKRAVFYDPLWRRIDNFFDKGTRDTVKERKSELLKALYAPGLKGLLDFVGKNHITHLAINENYYSDRYLSRPGEWHEVAKIGVPGGSAVLSAARTYGRNTGNGMYILDCRDIAGLPGK